MNADCMGQEAGGIPFIFHVKLGIIARTTGGILATCSHPQAGPFIQPVLHLVSYRTHQVGLRTQPNTSFTFLPPG